MWKAALGDGDRDGSEATLWGPTPTHTHTLTLLLLCQVFWAIGTVFEVVLAVFVMPSLGWRWLLILSAVPLLLFAILCYVSVFLELQ